jgi:hypothetical protein
MSDVAAARPLPAARARAVRARAMFLRAGRVVRLCSVRLHRAAFARQRRRHHGVCRPHVHGQAHARCACPCCACSSYARSCVLGLWCACAAFVQIVRISLVNVADTARVRRVRLDPADFAHHRRRHPLSRPPPQCIQMILGAVHACVLCSHARVACTCCVCACSACFRFARLRTTVPPCLVVYTHAYAHL